ncbi:otospiralin-like [Pygocentrus nattereri]|uniref:otospiralin-like n=1 Tax=Pygocentrus nattereri TaxID=42514 RepID=UPI00189174C8|nr:otospiralin-like [Pygocentrus nattereri]
MHQQYVSVLLCTLILASLSITGAESEERSFSVDEDDKGNEEKHIMPYWNMWSSDFYGWMEELRAQAAYDTLLDLARTYWAHFPIASYLGYDSIPNENDQTEKETNN